MSSDAVNTDRPTQCSLSSFYEKKSINSSNQSHSCKSAESLYSVSSTNKTSLSMYKRKPSRTMVTNATPNNEIRQRVLSARMNRMRSYQNQLNDAQMHISELSNENRILRTLHKRQDTALAKYENTNAELPQLLHAHTEEIRMWQTRVRTLQTQNKELSQKLKQKDSMMQGLIDQNKHLQQLNNNKNLEERDKLSDRVSLLVMRLQEKDDEMKLMTRRLQLETKSIKSQLHAEQARFRDLHQKYGDLIKSSSSSSTMSVPKLVNGVKLKLPTIKLDTPPPIIIKEQPRSSRSSGRSDEVSAKVPSVETKHGDTLVEMIRKGMGDITVPVVVTSSPEQLNSSKDANYSVETKDASTRNVIDVEESDSECDKTWENYDEEDEEIEQDDDEEEDDGATEQDEEEETKEARISWSNAKIWKTPITAEVESETDLEKLRRDHRADVIHRASFLDSMCERLENDTQPNFGNGSGDGLDHNSFSKHTFASLPSTKSLIPRQVIDPQKKSQLLQALRNIESK